MEALAAVEGASAAPLRPGAARQAASSRLKGISLAGFEAIISEAGGRAVLAGKSINWLKLEYVLPVTHLSGCSTSLADLLAARPDGADLVGDATVALSIRYTDQFLALVDAVMAWDARQRVFTTDGTRIFFILTSRSLISTLPPPSWDCMS